MLIGEQNRPENPVIRSSGEAWHPECWDRMNFVRWGVCYLHGTCRTELSILPAASGAQTRPDKREEVEPKLSQPLQGSRQARAPGRSNVLGLSSGRSPTGGNFSFRHEPSFVWQVVARRAPRQIVDNLGRRLPQLLLWSELAALCDHFNVGCDALPAARSLGRKQFPILGEHSNLGPVAATEDFLRLGH